MNDVILFGASPKGELELGRIRADRFECFCDWLRKHRASFSVIGTEKCPLGLILLQPPATTAWDDSSTSRATDVTGRRILLGAEIGRASAIAGAAAAACGDAAAEHAKTKPPLGLRPRRVAVMDRFQEVVAAIQRHVEAQNLGFHNDPLPESWLSELHDLSGWLQRRR